MADDTLRSSTDQAGSGRGSSRGASRAPRDGREGREPGGFRIRLSDNEMQAARALQEAFGLRSTVAVLGFSLRTLAQQLEAGQLDELVAQQKAQAGSRGPGAGGGRREGERRPGRDEARAGEPTRGVRANPFARPSRPAPVAPEPEPEPVAIAAEGDGAAEPPEVSATPDLHEEEATAGLESADAETADALQTEASPEA